jgi:predicted DsbA family dithiol-disulfide isomerase
MLDHLAATARQLGLPFGDRRMTYNSRGSQELGKWAESQGRGEAYNRAVFQAYFAEGLNIAQVPVLQAVAEKIGLDPVAAGEILRRRPYRTAVDADWQRCHAMGITAVPTFLLEGRMLVGAQPYQALVDLMAQMRVPPRQT